MSADAADAAAAANSFPEDSMLRLRHTTPEAWKDTLRADLTAFLRDHAHNERKVAGAALQLATHNPHRSELVRSMIALAQEEVEHFRQVHEILLARGEHLGHEERDLYMGEMHKLLRRHDTDTYLLDRLLAFGIIEARGCERFRMVAEALAPDPLADFYWELVRCEARHHQSFVAWARTIFGDAVVDARLEELLDGEAAIAAALPMRAAMH
jgi:tRNA 2-(methylsulfanyl)-N6-isopentenyladenosine37 hydroxylase